MRLVRFLDGPIRLASGQHPMQLVQDALLRVRQFTAQLHGTQVARSGHHHDNGGNIGWGKKTHPDRLVLKELTVLPTRGHRHACADACLRGGSPQRAERSLEQLVLIGQITDEGCAQHLWMGDEPFPVPVHGHRTEQSLLDFGVDVIGSDATKDGEHLHRHAHGRNLAVNVLRVGGRALAILVKGLLQTSERNHAIPSDYAPKALRIVYRRAPRGHAIIDRQTCRP